MLTLAYRAGLRLGEIVRLTLGDIDLEQTFIDVRDTKRERTKTDAPQTPLFVHGKGGYSYTAAGQLLRGVIRRAGLHQGRGLGGRRIHDLRQHADFPIMPSCAAGWASAARAASSDSA